MDEKVKTLETTINQIKVTSVPEPETYENLISEMNERKARSRNLILTSVPEQFSSDNNERMKLEKVEVNKILMLIDKECPEPKKNIRLGKYNQNKTRAIKLIFENKSTPIALLRKRDALKNHKSRIYSDQTPKQREYLNSLKQKLECRIRNGENLSIKYVKGTPTIIETIPKNYPQ
ncbi:unnamed protein product, partial [Brenthis ino]